MASEKELHFKVGPERAGIRIDKVLRDLIPDHSRTYLKELIEKGFVKIGKKVIDVSRHPVANGDEISIEIPPKKELAAQPKKFPLRVIYQDSQIAVIDKPAGIAAHPSPHSKGPTVADVALEMFGDSLPRGQGADRPGIVHRLDRDTSGIMLITKTKESFDSLRAQFKERTVEKEYRAIVRGVLRFDSDYIEGLIARDSTNPEKMAIVREDGKESTTFYETLERFEDFSYVRCRPKTGRTHQIRLHLSHLGHPIVGDGLYKLRGASWNCPDGAPPAKRQFLHAYSISFLHPQSGDLVSFESPLHEDMQAFLNFLRKKNPPKDLD